MILLRQGPNKANLRFICMADAKYKLRSELSRGSKNRTYKFRTHSKSEDLEDLQMVWFWNGQNYSYIFGFVLGPKI